MRVDCDVWAAPSKCWARLFFFLVFAGARRLAIFSDAAQGAISSTKFARRWAIAGVVLTGGRAAGKEFAREREGEKLGGDGRDLVLVATETTLRHT